MKQPRVPDRGRVCLGESLLSSLRASATPRVQLTESDPEGWRWCSYADWGGHRYLIGASRQPGHRAEHAKRRPAVTKAMLWSLSVGMSLLLCGCAAEVPLNRGMDPSGIESRAQWLNAAGMNRAEVIARLGEPWIADPARRVDVFKASETQHNAVVIFAPYPVPLPSFSRQFSAYSLVIYGPEGMVEGADHVFAVTGVSVRGPEIAGAKPAARAGDYEFVQPYQGPSHATLSVTHARWLKDRALEPRPTGECTVVTVCGARTSEPAGEATSGGVCWQLLRADGRDLGQAVVMNLWSVFGAGDVHARATAMAGPRAGALHCSSGGCIFVGPISTAISLPAGTHELSYSSSSLEGGANARLDCAPGELWYARVGGKLERSYSVSEQFVHGMRLGSASGTVKLSRELPADVEPPLILLYLNGKPLGGRGAP